jgi:predicted dehydrogenase
VLIATPDHTHAAIAAAALRAGKHVYCEKPLTHTVREARAIADLAKQTKLVTQMGIQIHSMDNYRRVVELIQADAIGPVREVHIWNDRKNRPAEETVGNPPAELNYDLWLGPLPPQPYRRGFHPYNWRRWWSFGSGLLGDIGCHLMDVAFWALDLKHPTKISAEGSPRSDELCAEWIVARYEFPARGSLPPVALTWYDPPKKPPMIGSWNLEEKLAGEGVMFLGERGMLYTNYTERRVLPAERFKDFKAPTTRIAHSPGHQREWIEACLTNDPAAVGAPFAYGALLSETALLGVAAFRAATPLQWDPASGKCPNAPEAEHFLTYQYRPGWTL